RLERARHVEVQILGDGRGNAVHLFERECSLQRRHQKVIEEAPSPAIGEDLRDRMTSAALRLAKAVRYRGAGTVEMLVADDGPFVRVDRGIETGDAVAVHYDPLLSKIVAYGATREAALARLVAALDAARVHGVITNLPFLRALARSREVAGGRYDTEWIEREF